MVGREERARAQHTLGEEHLHGVARDGEVGRDARDVRALREEHGADGVRDVPRGAIKAREDGGVEAGQLTINDAQVSDVGVRLRGKVGSFRTLDGKPKLRSVPLKHQLSCLGGKFKLVWAVGEVWVALGRVALGLFVQL